MAKGNRKKNRKIEARVGREMKRTKHRIAKAESKSEVWCAYEHKGRPMFGKPQAGGRYEY